MEREFKFRAWIELGDNSEIKAMLDDVAIYTQSHSGNCGMSMDDFIEAIKEQTGYEYNDGQFIYNRHDETPDRDAIDAEEFNVYETEEWFLFDGEIMQYVGLKDKNGKEIYEGDIVRLFHGHPSWLIDPFYVIFQCSAFALKKKDKSGSTAFATYLHDCVTNGIIMNDDDESALFEVIGNVWQNPELINKATS